MQVEFSPIYVLQVLESGGVGVPGWERDNVLLETVLVMTLRPRTTAQTVIIFNCCICQISTIFISSELWTLEWLGILSRLLLLPDADQGVYRDLWWRWDREFSELGPNRHIIRPLEPLELLELLQSLLWWVSLQVSSLYQRRLYHWAIWMSWRGFRDPILLWS